MNIVCEQPPKEIKRFIRDWLENNPNYGITSSNCQKFAIEFIGWLTNLNYRVTRKLDFGVLSTEITINSNLLMYGQNQVFIARGYPQIKGQRQLFGMVGIEKRGPYM